MMEIDPPMKKDLPVNSVHTTRRIRPPKGRSTRLSTQFVRRGTIDRKKTKCLPIFMVVLS